MAHDDETGAQVETPEDSTTETEDPKELLKKVITVEVADAGVLRRTVNITVPQASLQSELDKEYDELVAEAVVPGFRRGRAPRQLVEKRFGRNVNDQVQSRIVSNAYLAAVEKEDIKVLGDPLFWVHVPDKEAPDKEGAEQLVDLQKALEHISLPETGDLSFRCEVEVKPEFELPDLEGVPIEKPDLKISDQDVSVQIDRMLATRGQWAPLDAGGKVKNDDMLICDVTMSVDGKKIKTIDNMTMAARPQRIEGAVISDLGDQMKGSKVGDSKTMEAPLSDDYEVEDLRGKTAVFDVKINEIKRLQLPPLDEVFLSSYGFDSEDEYRTWVRSKMESQLDQEIKGGMRRQVREYLLEKTKLDLPEGLSSRQTDRVVRRRIVELQRQGVAQHEIEKHVDELRTGAQEQGANELKLFFILEEIAEKLELKVTEEEINTQIAAMARAYNRRFDRIRDELAKNDGLLSLYVELRDEKCIDNILEKARITETKTTKKKKTGQSKTATQAKEKSSEKPKSEQKPPAAPKAKKKKVSRKSPSK